ncbi:hypothetical protein [Actinomadura napierensis]|uniref:Uncharacterized protein n=1 Tax=Actinomadura napierensis TaxID=267854 RepID=A0ABN2YKQ0_9ACTN
MNTSPETRRRLSADLAFLGFAVDQDRNAAAHADAVISPPGAAVATVVVSAREDLERRTCRPDFPAAHQPRP